MPLTPQTLTFLKQTNVHTDPESAANAIDGQYFHSTSDSAVHPIGSDMFFTVGAQAFIWSAPWPGTDGAATVSSNTAVGISLFKLDIPAGDVHVLQSHQWVGSREAQHFKYVVERNGYWTATVYWAARVSLTTTTGGTKRLAVGAVSVNALTGTITEINRSVLPDSHMYQGSSQDDLYYTLQGGQVHFCSDTNNPNLKIGYIDCFSGASSYFLWHVVNDAGAPGSNPNWNQGTRAIWVTEYGTVMMRSSSRRASLSGSNFDVHEAVHTGTSWSSSIIASNLGGATAGLLVNQGAAQGRGSNGYTWGGSFLSRSNLQVSTFDVDGTPFPKIIDPDDALPNMQWSSVEQIGTSSAETFGVQVTFFSGSNYGRYREYNTDGSERGAWSRPGHLSTHHLPIVHNRVYFAQFSANNVTVLGPMEPLEEPCATERYRIWQGTAFNGVGFEDKVLMVQQGGPDTHPEYDLWTAGYGVDPFSMYASDPTILPDGNKTFLSPFPHSSPYPSGPLTGSSAGREYGMKADGASGLVVAGASVTNSGPLDVEHGMLWTVNHAGVPSAVYDGYPVSSSGWRRLSNPLLHNGIYYAQAHPLASGTTLVRTIPGFAQKPNFSSVSGTRYASSDGSNYVWSAHTPSIGIVRWQPETDVVAVFTGIPGLPGTGYVYGVEYVEGMLIVSTINLSLTTSQFYLIDSNNVMAGATFVASSSDAMGSGYMNWVGGATRLLFYYSAENGDHYALNPCLVASEPPGQIPWLRQRQRDDQRVAYSVPGNGPRSRQVSIRQGWGAWNNYY